MPGSQNITKPPRLIDIRQAVKRPVFQWLIHRLEAPIEKTLAVNAVNDIYAQVLQMPPGENFYAYCNKILGVRVDVSRKDGNRIPGKGPLVVVANHPFGGLEGIVLGEILTAVRPDVKIIGNYLLKQIKPMAPDIIPVDPFDNQASIGGNGRAMMDAVRWVKKGGAVIVFPAGEVSHLQRGKVADPPWSPHIGALIRLSRAKALPVFFPGRNSALFNLMGLIHARVRTAFLARELVKKRNKPLLTYIGNPIAWTRLSGFTTNEALTDYLRFNTYFLANRDKSPLKSFPVFPLKKTRLSFQDNVSDATPDELIRHEIQRLPRDHKLVESKTADVYFAGAGQIPAVLKEICRLREITFRDVNEGTNRTLDRDRFDAHYYHLFLWDKIQGEIIGAYRLGLTDEILSLHGENGLYTHSLFHYQPEFMNGLTNAIELGRSFIRKEYQKKHTSLTLLWRGIGAFVVRAGRYNKLFGAVSISRDYHPISKDLMVKFLQHRKADPDLARMVKARKPFKSSRLKLRNISRLTAVIRDIDDVSILVSGLESDGKGIPVLIRQYLKLDARFIGFNVDPAFSDCVDGLIHVDLTKINIKLLKRFMGRGGYEQFARIHLIKNSNENLTLDRFASVPDRQSGKRS